MNTNWAQDYIGIPYALHGRSRAGVDCYGLVCLVFNDLLDVKLDIFDGKYNDHTIRTNATLISDCGHFGWSPVPFKATLQAFDVAVLSLAGYPAHVALMLDNDTFMHSIKPIGVVLERLSSLRWKNRVKGIMRHDACVRHSDAVSVSPN